MQWMVGDAVKNPLVYWTLVVGIVAAAVCARCLVALQPYSGMGQPPEFGDFEAQRHWMELTVNLDVHEWYVNGTHNNLTYWGIDYPPLTAYFSWAWGKLFVFLHESIIANTHELTHGWMKTKPPHPQSASICSRDGGTGREPRD